MKKIKLLTSLGAISALGSGVAVIATGCSEEKKLDASLAITLNYANLDIVSPGGDITWKFYVSYNALPTKIKKLEVTSSNNNVATIDAVNVENQSFRINGVDEGNADITIKITDSGDHYNEYTHTIYVAGDDVGTHPNYIGTIYGRYVIDYEFTQADINELVPNYNGNITIADVPLSPTILTELHIGKIKDDAVINLPSNFLKGCTNLRKLNLSGIKTTSIQNTYLANPDGNFATNLLQELVVPEIVLGSQKSEIVITDFLNTTTGLPSLTKVDLTGFKNVKRIKGWWFCNKCTALTDINLYAMENLVEIGVGFMQGCTSLKNVTLWQQNGDEFTGLTKLQVIRNSFMIGCTGLESLDMSGLENLKVIGGEFLKNCISLTSIKLPGRYAQQQGKLVPIAKSSPLQSIGWDTEGNSWKVYGQFLYGCSSLTSIDITMLDTSKIQGPSYAVSGVDAEFREASYPKCSIYSSTAALETETDAPSYNFFGCNSLTNIDFGSITWQSFFSNSGNIDATSFFTKSFDTEEAANTYIENGEGLAYDCQYVKPVYLATTTFKDSAKAIQIEDKFYVRKWKAYA